jgi:hypothetical protein
MPEPAPLLVFSDDWGRHPSSCQHLIRHLIPHRFVTWVNTIGMRRPRFDRATATRGFEKLREWFAPESAPDFARLAILSPKMWPSFRSRFARWLNRCLLARAVRAVTETEPAPIAITTLPLVADLVGRVRAARWVYYCVDDYSAWPGLDGRTLRAMEAELVEKVDVAIAVSEPLHHRLAKPGRPAHLLTHGVDLEFWRKQVPSEVPASLRDLASIPGPLVVFWGVIDRRMETEFLCPLGETMTEGTILLVGPRDRPDPSLARMPRLRNHPPVPLDDLPFLANRAAVLIAPYTDLPVTRAMQPLKLKEYLATGKPVVVRKLPATEPWADCCDVMETPEAFASAVMQRLQTGLPDDQRRARERLKDESWAAKAALFEKWVDGL